MRLPQPTTNGDLAWRVASRCNGGACVCVASDGDTIIVGDTKNPDGPVLGYTREEWKVFVEGIIQGDFDDII